MMNKWKTETKTNEHDKASETSAAVVTNQVFSANTQHTLFASRTHGIRVPSGNETFESRSFFHRSTASYVDGLVMSKTMKHPTASL